MGTTTTTTSEMSRSSVAVLLVVAALFVAHVNAHAVLIHPPPRVDNDLQLKAYPCGTGAENGYPSTGATVLAPGTNYITFRETINDSGYDSRVLLDHIGHNDAGSTSENANPSGKYHIVEVDIPDVACGGSGEPTCTLQLVQVMSDKFPGASSCAPNQLSNACGDPSWTYFSCSTLIQITGSGAPVNNLYTDYAQPANPSARDWEQDEVSTWVQDCGDYWRLSGQTIPESVCLNGPTAAAAATTTVYTAAIFGLAAVVAFLA